MCVLWLPIYVGQLPEDVISGVNFQFGVIDVFLIRESAIQCYTKVGRVDAVLKRCSRPSDVKGSVFFPVPEQAWVFAGFACRWLRS